MRDELFIAVLSALVLSGAAFVLAGYVLVRLRRINAVKPHECASYPRGLSSAAALEVELELAKTTEFSPAPWTKPRSRSPRRRRARAKPRGRL